MRSIVLLAAILAARLTLASGASAQLGDAEWVCSDTVCPHAGVSLQTPLRRRLDLRLDFQALLAHAARVRIPRAAVGLVWHRQPPAAPEGTAPEEPAATPWAPPRLEVGGTVGAIWLTPTIGMLASLPATDRTSVEGGINMAPRYVMMQGQARVRLPIGPPGGARRSLVLGLTHLSQRTMTAGVLQTGLAAHAGMSAQAPVSRRFDVRVDAQMIAPFRAGPDADLRAVMAIVWHPRAAR